MLSIKENLRETLKKDGHPDRFVNQYEYMNLSRCLIPCPARVRSMEREEQSVHGA